MVDHRRGGFGRLAAVGLLAVALSPGAFAFTQEQLDWAHNLQAPVTGWRCSDIQDSEFTQQDIQLGSDGAIHWFARVDDQWVQVPDENVITSGNRFPEPIIWYSRYGGQIYIRCMVPGALG